MTGELDEETLHEMKKPRCGVADVDADGGRQKRFATFGKWPRKDLKYYMEYGNDMSHADQLRIITRAFKYWSDVAPKLRFTYAKRKFQANLWIRLVAPW